MNALKIYLLRLICCGFFVSLSGVLCKGRKGCRAVALCGGCLMILTAVRPILRVDLTRLPDLITGLTASERQELARQKNDELLRSITEEQTEVWLSEQASALELELRFRVRAQKNESGIYVPREVTVTGTWTSAAKEALSRILREELGIPAENQRWVIG